MLFDNSAETSGLSQAEDTEAGRRYSVAVFGQTGEEIGEWDLCTQLREEPGRISFIDDRGHVCIIRGGIIVVQEQD